MEKLKESNKIKLKAFLSALVRVAVAAALFAAIVTRYDSLKTVDVRRLTADASSQTAAAAAVISVYLVKALTMVLPASVLYIGVGMSFPVPQALLINLAGICVEITATYFLGRLLGGDLVGRIIKKNRNAEKLLDLKRGGGRAFVFLLRFSPLPLDFSSLFLGASRFSFAPYFFMSLLGVAPRVAALTVLGFGLYEYIPTEVIIAAVLCAIPGGVAVWLVRRFWPRGKGAAVQRSLPKK